nr:hypothetical protein [Tanacetum cinerariifolium]
MISYTSISSPERSWDIPDVDPYKEAALQVAPPLSPAYLPDPIELDKHVSVNALGTSYSIVAQFRGVTNWYQSQVIENQALHKALETCLDMSTTYHPQTDDCIMTDSWHSMVSYTSNSSRERSWDIPDLDPYKEAALQAIEQVTPPLSPAYLPNPIELDENVPVYVLEPKYPKYLEPPADDIVAEDQPYADDAEHSDYVDEPEEEDLEEEDPKEEDPEEKEESDDNAASEEEPSEGFDDTEPSEEDETAAQVTELLAMPTPPPSPFTLMSSPLHQIPSPPLLVPSPPPMPSSPLPPPVPVETHAPKQDVAAALYIYYIY